MENKLQCPQCGGASTHKISETEYHCNYCQSSFNVNPSKSDFINELLKQKEGAQQKRAEILATQAVYTAKAKKTGIIITVAVLVFVFGILGAVFFSVRNQLKNSPMLSGWQEPSINKFDVFSGSKGAVCWLLMEQHGSRLDSAKYTLKIIDLKTNTTLKEFNYFPVMAWKESFNISSRIGKFIQFGDTCWIATDNNGLTARDIYSGDVIIDGKQLAQRFPKLSQGITKAEYLTSNKLFELTTSDGFEYKYSPVTNNLYSKDEFKQNKKADTLVRTFFSLSREKRPQLIKSIEKTDALATESSLGYHWLKKYIDKIPGYQKDKNIISANELNPDKAYFNGTIAYSDNNKAIIFYQKTIAKNAEMIISCIDAEGKELWQLTKNELNDFSDVFADRSGNIDFSATKHNIILSFQNKFCRALGIDTNTGKVLWRYSSETTPVQ